MSRPKWMFFVRELDAYPTGRKRIFLLFVVILANFVANYESQMAPVLSLILKDIGISNPEYGLIVSLSVVAAAFGALLGGPLSDRYGRTLILVPGLLLTVLCVFGMIFVNSFGSLLFMRVVLNFIERGFIGATAGLVRDFSPRMGRALSFGFWSYGTSGSNFFAALVAGYTLPYFGTWQSQFYIAGFLSLIVAIFVMFTIHDLSPRLREKVILNSATAEEVNKPNAQPEFERKATKTTSQAISGKVEDATSSHAMTPMQTLRLAMKQKHIWALAIGCTFFLMLYLTLASYGPLILVQAFGYTPARAAFVSQFFWLFSLVTLIVSGYISDKLQLRKVISLIGVLGMIAVMSIWILTMHNPVSEMTMILLISLMGGCLGFAYSPWMALYSENLEDLHGGIQASGWAVWSFVLRIYAIISAIPLNLIAVRYGWDTWLWITLIGAIIYIPLLCLGKGPWFKRPLSGRIPTAVDS
ncbi:MFS transporter [Brevibacillus choshinensis]|uniref:MFS transporter n=1 Tax=Brevibacillus choshinensis TaxID=54911 RepID=UPI002E1B4245|nr:MFS transporter [Brevibacillus choshinensis]MED4781779.1 MFS transporter [Brevibacillus choshinensis]